MRFYAIKVIGAPADIFPPRYQDGAQWGTETPDGRHDANAQQIEFNIIEWTSQTPSENSTLTIHGVSWDQIKHSNKLVGKLIYVWGGMNRVGLPLSNFQSQRPRLLLEAVILKCWGNWIGTEMSIGMSFVAAGAYVPEQGGGGAAGGGAVGGSSGGGASFGGTSLTAESRFVRKGPRAIDGLPFNVGSSLGSIPQQAFSILGGALSSNFDIGSAVFSSGGGVMGMFFGGGNVNPLAAPLNIIHNMLPNMPMASAMKETLSRAFPNSIVKTLISPLLKFGYQDAGMYQSLEQYMNYINKASQSILGTKKYPGVQLTSYNKELVAYDFSSIRGDGDIHYFELIGQPTWLTVTEIHVKVVLRGGIHVGHRVTIPDTLIGFAGANAMIPSGLGIAAPDQRTHISLPGTYQCTKINHIGDFRNPDGSSWCTNYELTTSAAVAGQAEAAKDAAEADAKQSALEQRFPSFPTDI